MNATILRLVRISLLLSLLAHDWAGKAQEVVAPTEYQVKAAFLYNFAKFVDWPSSAFAAADSPITIGLLGKNPFGPDLERTVQNKSVSGHSFVIQQLTSAADVALNRCQIVFINPEEKNHLEEIFAKLNGKVVLTVSETDGFIQSGGMINFVMEGKKVRFEINGGAAKQAGLKISSKLLSLAKKPEASR